MTQTEPNACDAGDSHSVALVAEPNLPELLPLMRAYCDFYDVQPSDDALLTLSRALIADPQHEGLQLIARDPAGTAVAFATIYWSWSTAKAAQLGIMNDLFVAPPARGSGLADRLIAACIERCRCHGAAALQWETALENERAQAVYDRVGGVRERWLSYSIDVHRG